MDIQIRRSNSEDLTLLQSLFQDTIRSTCSPDYSKKQLEAWTDSIENKDRWLRLVNYQYTLVATYEDEVVGFGALDDGDYLDFLYVNKDFFRKGVASKLYNELKLESLRQGFYKLQSDVSITARPFFQAKGFEVIKENIKVVNGVELVNYRMIEL